MKMRPFKNKELSIKTFVLLILFALVCHIGIGQELSKKELKEKKKAIKVEETLELLESKTFVFKGSRALTNRGRSIDLTTRQNFVKFNPESIESDMPFFGTATSGVAYGGGDGGYSFTGKPSKFNFKKDKKNYKVDVEVKDSKDNYVLFLSVGFEGGATLNISSNNRSTMTYFGDILKE